MYLKLLTFFLSFIIVLNSAFPVLAEDTRYNDYAKMYVGEDKFEKFNRKMFNLNTKLNKFVARPVHILWASVMPQYGMDRIQNVYNNIEYPKRLASCLLQRDGAGIKNETIRFLTNSTIGLGGLFDPAAKMLKIKPTNENMDQALCKCKVKSGSYFVLPVLSSCTPRSLCGRTIEAALDPSVYIATPLTALVKFGLMVNRTSYMQPLIKMLESTYADPYDVQKKLYGLENYIKNSNLDRQNLLETEAKLVNADSIIQDEIAMLIEDNYDSLDNPPEKLGESVGAAANIEDLDIIKYGPVEPDITLENFNSQSPIVDSMRTALFDNPDINKSIWNELSIWNRSFEKQVKTGSVNIVPGREDYKFRYIMQKDKNSPLIILYPSVGEGYNTRHSTVFAKMFYDEGYSIVILGSHFHWQFVKSMPEGYYPGVPYRDADNIKLVTHKILTKLEDKYNTKFEDKTIIGTSFGAMASLFVADKESKNNTLGISKFIAISPPVELVYAVEQLDKHSKEMENNIEDVKHKTAVTAAKVLQITKIKEASPTLEISELPFTEQEGKLIVTFLLRQKLSDLIYTIESASKKSKTADIYQAINNTSYRDYVEKYLLKGEDMENIRYESSLYSLADYFENNDNYKIYHSPDDFFATEMQISKLKAFTGNHLTCLSNGSHLGFLYRKEFQEALKSEVENKI